MASTLRILPEIETKSLVCEGIIAVREAVALTVVMPPGSMESGDDIHVRIRGKLGDVAKFPFDDADEWTATPDDAGNTVLTATLNCNTDALIKSFRFIPENGKMTFLVAVENDTQNCLVARGRVTVMNWIGDGDMQDPETIESELAEIAGLKQLVETKVIASVEQIGGHILFTFGDGTTFETGDLTGPQGQQGPKGDDGAGLTLGETSSTAYAGNKGKANADAIAAIKDGTNIDSFGDVETALTGKQATISDLATIRSGAAAGATAYQKPSTGIPATDIASGVIPDVSGKADAADLRYALDGAPREPDEQTGEVELDDRAVNWVHHSSGGVKLIFPDAVTGRARDFFVRMDSESTGTGNISLTFETDVSIETADGNLPDVPEGKTTILYFTEMLDDTFLFKAETVKSV